MMMIMITANANRIRKFKPFFHFTSQHIGEGAKKELFECEL
jgi:hypothetical protein